MFTMKIYDVIRDYTGKALILHGDQDRIVPLKYSVSAAKVIPNAELIVIPGQEHGFTGMARRQAMEKEWAFIQRYI